MKLRTLIPVLAVSIISAFATSWYVSQNIRHLPNAEAEITDVNSTTDIHRVSNTGSYVVESADFVYASEVSTPSVVFIKTESQAQASSSFWFFGYDPFGRMGKVSSSGSGVIVSKDGYIITNHHVVKNADKIEVVLDKGKRSYPAKIIGTAASSDLALIKIEGKNLPAISIGNSDNVKIGEWVLAVGNPFNLTSTVTAGIVSAKGRNINIVNNAFPIESFIQTDAAINPGNSGGALVNLKGDLIGLNTAIASQTGAYVGYGFAIPVNIVVKIVDDLKQFGQIQRGFDGLDVVDLNADLIDQTKREEGVYVVRVNSNNPNTVGKFKDGDLIIKVNGHLITSKAQYDELLAYQRPGDSMHYLILRNGAEKEIDITLVNDEGTTSLNKKVSVRSEELGAEFEIATKIERDLYNISHGVKVSSITSGKIREMRLQEGFIFLEINDKKADNLNEFVNYLEKAKGQVRITGISPSGSKQFLSFYIY